MTNSVIGQDFDIYPRLKDDNVKVPELYEKVSFDEFKILSRNIRMMDMPYSLIVPGIFILKPLIKQWDTLYLVCDWQTTRGWLLPQLEPRSWDIELLTLLRGRII